MSFLICLLFYAIFYNFTIFFVLKIDFEYIDWNKIIPLFPTFCFAFKTLINFGYALCNRSYMRYSPFSQTFKHLLLCCSFCLGKFKWYSLDGRSRTQEINIEIKNPWLLPIYSFYFVLVVQDARSHLHLPAPISSTVNMPANHHGFPYFQNFEPE